MHKRAAATDRAGGHQAIDPRIIVRRYPEPGERNAATNYFPAIEFDQPDFPWRHTPARASSKDRLRPWLMIFDQNREKVLLTQRGDNGRWCLPGGGMDSGENVAQACEREVWEETGLRVRVTHLVGVYSNPDQLVIYPDGNKGFFVVLNFEAQIIGGELGLSDETSDFGYFTMSEIEELEMFGRHARNELWIHWRVKKRRLLNKATL